MLKNERAERDREWARCCVVCGVHSTPSRAFTACVCCRGGGRLHTCVGGGGGASRLRASCGGRRTESALTLRRSPPQPPAPAQSSGSPHTHTDTTIPASACLPLSCTVCLKAGFVVYREVGTKRGRAGSGGRVFSRATNQHRHTHPRHSHTRGRPPAPAPHNHTRTAVWPHSSRVRAGKQQQQRAEKKTHTFAVFFLTSPCRGLPRPVSIHNLLPRTHTRIRNGDLASASIRPRLVVRRVGRRARPPAARDRAAPRGGRRGRGVPLVPGGVHVRRPAVPGAGRGEGGGGVEAQRGRFRLAGREARAWGGCLAGGRPPNSPPSTTSAPKPDPPSVDWWWLTPTGGGREC